VIRIVFFLSEIPNLVSRNMWVRKIVTHVLLPVFFIENLDNPLPLFLIDL